MKFINIALNLDLRTYIFSIQMNNLIQFPNGGTPPYIKATSSPSPFPRCPGAPKCRENYNRIPYWKFLRSSGRIQRKYLNYTPEDVQEIDYVPTLRRLYEQYSGLM